MAGNYNEELRLKGDPELLELADSLNDLSDVFRLTHENLAQEKNRLSSVLSYMSDGVIATNRRGQITMINSTAQRLLNLDYETATQMSILDLLDGENPYTYSELLSKTPEIHLSRRDYVLILPLFVKNQVLSQVWLPFFTMPLSKKKKSVNVDSSSQTLVMSCVHL